ncbi:MAG: hypothetical protein ACRDXX_05750 [Stackebrandtia sp.]
MSLKTAVSPRAAVKVAAVGAATLTILGASVAVAVAEPDDWNVIDTPVLDQEYWFEAAAVLGGDDAWAVGTALAAGNEGYDDGVAMHWNGVEWTNTPGLESKPLSDVVALSSDEVWAVGSHQEEGLPAATRWNGGEWESTPVPPPDEPGGDSRNDVLYGVDAAASDDVWAVGTANSPDGHMAFAEHWDGAEWSLVELPVPDDAAEAYLNSVTVVSADEAWAVGSVDLGADGTRPWMLRYDGQQWSETPVDDVGGEGRFGLFDVTTIDGLDGAWASGLHGGEPLLLHWSGERWEAVDTPVADGRLEAAGPDGEGGMFLAGRNSNYQPVLMRYRDGVVTEEESPLTGDIVMLWDVEPAADSDDVWLVGDVKADGVVVGGVARRSP